MYVLEVALGCWASAIIYRKTRVYGDYQWIISINASTRPLTLQPNATPSMYMYLHKTWKNSSVELKFILFQSKDLTVCWSDGNLSSNYQQVLRRGEGPGHNDLIHVSINCQNCNYFSAQFVCVCLCGRQLPSWATNDNHWSELLVAPGYVQLWLEPFQSLYREWGICGKTDTQQRAVFYEHS